jgi:hypothetical protein
MVDRPKSNTKKTQLARAEKDLVMARAVAAGTRNAGNAVCDVTCIDDWFSNAFTLFGEQRVERACKQVNSKKTFPFLVYASHFGICRIVTVSCEVHKAVEREIEISIVYGEAAISERS